MIPKKIHYVWIGKRPKGKIAEICINSWRRVMPDYEIIEWNEETLDLPTLCEKNRFLKKCCELKLWAFVSDYIRLHVLYQEGGIYMDTDVEAVKPFDDFLSDPVFMGYEAGNYIGTAVIGAEKGNDLMQRLLRFYDKEIWNVRFINNPIIFKNVMDREPDYFRHCKIYPINYFSKKKKKKSYDCIVDTEETYAIHWYTQNWNMSRKGYVFMHTKHVRNPLKKGALIIRKNIGYTKKQWKKKYS